MRKQLIAYNKLLEKSFIDIQKYDVPKILIKPKRRRRSDEAVTTDSFCVDTSRKS